MYIGIVDNIEESVKELKLKIYLKSFTARFNCDKLFYFEEFENGSEVGIREKRFKKWKREWKIKLIKEMNPSWPDLNDNWNLNYNSYRN